MKGMSNAVMKDIKKAASAPKKVTKQEMPERMVPAEVDMEMGEYLQLQINLEQINRDIAEIEPRIIEVARKFQDDEAYKGQFSNSYRLVGANHSLRVIFQSRFSPIKPEDGPVAQEIAGKDLIAKTETLSVRKEFKDSEALQKLLIKKLGEDFVKYFQIIEEFAPVKGMSGMIYKAIKAEDLPRFRELVKQYKPSMKE